MAGTSARTPEGPIDLGLRGGKRLRRDSADKDNLGLQDVSTDSARANTPDSETSSGNEAIAPIPGSPSNPGEHSKETLPEEESDTVVEVKPKKSKLPFWRKCSKCKQVNSDPNYQYCRACYQKRRELFPLLPRAYKKGVGSTSSNLDETVPTKVLVTDELCMLCNAHKKDGVHIHGKTAHLACCYKCAVKSWKRYKCCPICKRKVRNIIKVGS